MRENRRRLKSVTGQTNRLWPVLVMLLLLILVPTICVLWFMNEAVQNEHLAVREKLRDAYRGHLTLIRERLDDEWRRILHESDRLAEETPPAIVFDQCVRGGLADAVLCYDVSGQRVYPVEATPLGGPNSDDAQWQEANRLEFLENDSAAAADAYEAIANLCLDRQPADYGDAARAWQAIGRRLQCQSLLGIPLTKHDALPRTRSTERDASSSGIPGSSTTANLRAARPGYAYRGPDSDGDSDSRSKKNSGELANEIANSSTLPISTVVWQ